MNDDVLAEDFFPDKADWEAVQPPKPANLENVRKRVGKRCAHLTYERLEVKDSDKGWQYLSMARNVINILHKFEQAVPDAIRRDWKLRNILLEKGR
jgi:hypothetical protein